MKNLHKLLSLSTNNVIGMVVSESCKKDWLTPKPLSFFYPENTLVDDVGFNAELNGFARTLKNECYGDGATIITSSGGAGGAVATI